ncbi:hypothetical protein [Mycolicibacterium sphagni]|uniref:hypothetical protein n=1 Tax=Mycolicibacterium sphagni TaxID=1786 RepID=UPI0021F2A84C|nr:hypothetical protein [Mycolicibacterium sphagni]MCV7178829.1 hypothetical protein [Mycolicibacterium sphagni]
MIGQTRNKGGVSLGALVSGALAAGAVIVAPTAQATCASFFGINNGGGCSSSQTSIAIAIGTGAQAFAGGLFGTSFAVGTDSISSIPSGGRNYFNLAAAVGVNALAEAGGALSLAVAAGTNLTALAAETLHPYLPVANVALNLGLSSTNNLTVADGVGNLAVNLFGNGTGQDVRALGLANAAINIGGTGNAVRASVVTSQNAYASFAFNVLGSGNTVQAGGGPLAVAGAFNQTGATVTQASPGINLFTRLALAAAAQSHGPQAVKAASTPSASKTVVPAARDKRTT